MLLGLFEGRTASALRLQGAAFCHASLKQNLTLNLKV